MIDLLIEILEMAKEIIIGVAIFKITEYKKKNLSYINKTIHKRPKALFRSYRSYITC